MNKIIACYCRSSHEDQQIDPQIQEVKDYVKGHGLEVQYFIDEGHTGNDTERPGFKALQEKVFKGQVQTIIVQRLDRIARRMIDGIKALEGWLDSGIRMVSVRQQLDFSGPTGKMLAQLFFVLSEWETNIRKERQAVGIAEARKAGKYKGGKVGRRWHNEAQIRSLYKRGISITDIAKVKKVSRPTIYRYINSETKKIISDIDELVAGKMKDLIKSE